jgi:hypothetical protein
MSNLFQDIEVKLVVGSDAAIRGEDNTACRVFFSKYYLQL